MQIGDVVYLNSGSKPMTIIAQPQPGSWEVAWDGGNMTYPEAALTMVDPRPTLDRTTTDTQGML